MTKNTAENSLNFFFSSKIAIYLSLGLHKGRPQATREAFSPQKRHPAPRRNEIY
jgi:hypothetical protein